MARFNDSEDSSEEGRAKSCRYRVPKYDSPVMKQLNKSDPPVDLLGPNSSAAKAYSGAKPSPACFIVPSALAEEQILLPLSLEVDRTGAKVALQIMGNPVATRLLLDVKIGGANISRKHETRLEFYPGISGHVEGLSFEALVPTSPADGEKPIGSTSHGRRMVVLVLGSGSSFQASIQRPRLLWRL
jgi:hypothetical protein